MKFLRELRRVFVVRIEQEFFATETLQNTKRAQRVYLQSRSNSSWLLRALCVLVAIIRGEKPSPFDRVQ